MRKDRVETLNWNCSRSRRSCTFKTNPRLGLFFFVKSCPDILNKSCAGSLFQVTRSLRLWARWAAALRPFVKPNYTIISKWSTVTDAPPWRRCRGCHLLAKTGIKPAVVKYLNAPPSSCHGSETGVLRRWDLAAESTTGTIFLLLFFNQDSSWELC